MYRTCLYCSASLGANQALELFPVGRLLAFDAWKGRLWAICPRCARWNLAPIEERWEALEEAEKRFRAARLRAHSENIGLAALPDGTRLIRVGEALPGELAAWRYGDQLLRRRAQHLLRSAGELLLDNAVVVAAPVAFGVALPAAVAGVSVLGALSASAALGVAANLPQWWIWRRSARRVLLRLDASEAGPALIQAADAVGARLDLDQDSGVTVRLETEPLNEIRRATRWMTGVTMIREPVTVTGGAARRLLGRLMVGINRAGATRAQVAAALASIDLAGGPEAFLRRMAERRVGAGGRRDRRPRSAVPLPSRLDALALELALHEEEERQALAGELRALRAAWQEAEEIASIADSLPDPSPPASQERALGSPERHL